VIQICSVFLEVNLFYFSFIHYGVVTCSRLLKITGLFCKRALWKRRYSAKETYNFKEPTNRSHHTCVCVCHHDSFHTNMWHKLRECLQARRFRATLFLHTTYVHSCCTWRASCVDSKPKKQKKSYMYIYVRATLFLHTTCVHFCCTWRSSCVAAKLSFFLSWVSKTQPNH